MKCTTSLKSTSYTTHPIGNNHLNSPITIKKAESVILKQTKKEEQRKETTTTQKPAHEHF